MKTAATLPSTVGVLPEVARPALEPFNTTGSTTHADFKPLPGGWVRFHVVAEGKASGFFNGQFSFREWGMVDFSSGAPGFSANYGLMAISTDSGGAKVRFDGRTDPADMAKVIGIFQLSAGRGAYKGLRGGGTYRGDAGLAFAVDYEPCGKGKAPCPATFCAVRGGKLKVEDDEVCWECSNEGDAKLTLSSLRLWWPATNGAIGKVKVGRLVIADPGYHGPGPYDEPDSPLVWTHIDLSARGGDPQQVEIAKGKTKLELTFENAPSADLSGYVFLAQFQEGCAATYVGWPPPTE